MVRTFVCKLQLIEREKKKGKTREGEEREQKQISKRTERTSSSGVEAHA